MNYILTTLIVLLQFAFGIYLAFVMLRFLFQLVRADFYNPVSQAIFKLTNPPLKLLRRFIPGFRGVDWTCIVLLFIIQGLEIFLVVWFGSGRPPGIPALFILSLAKLLQLCAYIYMFFILVGVVISWINPGAYNPLTILIYQLTHPLLRIVRRRIPSVEGLDFSPMIVMLVLFLFLSLVVTPLFDLGYSLHSRGLLGVQ